MTIMFPLFLVFNVIFYGLVVHAKWSDKDTQKFSLINIYLGKIIEYQVAVRKNRLVRFHIFCRNKRFTFQDI